MANVCDYSMQIVGESKENIIKFIDLIQADYDYSLSDNPEHIGGRIDEANDDEIEESDGQYRVYIYGTCAWSVYTCMFGGEHTYYNDLKKEFQDKYKGKTITEVSLDLGLNIEIFSTEVGMGFAEHYLIKNGELIIDDEVPYNEYPAYEYETKEAFEEAFNISISDEKWENAGDWISFGGYDEVFTI